MSYLSITHSILASWIAIISESPEDVVKVCFIDVHDIVVPPHVNIYCNLALRGLKRYPESGYYSTRKHSLLYE